MREHPHKILFLLVILITASFSFPSPAFAQSESDFTVAEQWVLDQTVRGEIADLAVQFPNEEDHVLTASFLEKLLLKQFENLPQTENNTRYRIHIEHAIFEEPLVLENSEVPYEVWLGNSEFKQKVDFSESYFHQDLTLNGSIFDEDVDFYELQVGKDFGLVNVQFKNAKEAYNFRSMNVENFVFMEQAVFAGAVDFSYTEVGNNFEAGGSQFNYEGDANDKPNGFESMKIGGSAFFNPISINGEIRTVIFRGPVSFADVEVGHRFEAMGAQFNSKKLANFRHIKVDGTFTLSAKDYGEKSSYKTTFNGPIDFRYAEIGTNFEANDAQFNNPEQEAIFWDLKVGNAILMRRARFDGPVNFQKSIIDGDFSINNAQFDYKGNLQNENDDPKSNYFGNMKVGGAMLLNNATFEGPVDFRYSEVKTNFEGNDAQFNYKGMLFDNNKKQIVNNFGSMKISNSVQLNGAIFKGPVDFRYTQVGTNFELDTAKFQGGHDINFIHVRAEDTMSLEQTCFTGQVDFTNSQFGTFQMENATLANAIYISGMRYETIRFKKVSDSHGWMDLIWLVNQSRYNAQTYKTLETFFENQGHPERADEVYIAYKRRETQTLKDSKQGLWIWNWFFDKFVRFGRRPGQAWLWSLAIILLGALVFWKQEGMVDVSKKDSPLSEKDIYPYNPYWYSFDLFVGLVDLGFASRWEPKPGRRAAFIYSKVHKMAGWVLITIAVLTVTGLIK